MENDVSRPSESVQRMDVTSASTWSPSKNSSLQHSPLLHSSSPPAWQGTTTSETSFLSPHQEPNQRITAIESHYSSTWSNILKSRWLMVACLVFGIAAAVGHDTLNNHLFGKEAKNQIWWLRLGQSLAFVSKANSAIAISLAYEQITWRSVGQRSFSVRAIDSLFGAAHNAIELLNVEAWKKSWFVMLLALYMWISPLVVIFTSATLSVVRHENTACYSVRTLNFSHEPKKKWTHRRRADGDEIMEGARLSWYNDTLPDEDGPDVFDFWISPSAYLKEIASRVLTGGQALQRDDVADEICGKGWDCSTIIHFTGPGYKCEQLGKGTNSTLEQFNGRDAPFNMSRMIPEGWNTYYSIADEGDYAERQIEHEKYYGRPLQTLPFPKNLGAFRTEPIIWLGYVTVDDVLVKHAENSSQKGWDTDFTPVISACEHWQVNYTVSLTYTRGFQSYNVTNREYLRKVINTTYVDDSADDGTLDKTVAEPQENYVLPKDWRNYQRIAAYHSLGLKLRELLHGGLSLPDKGKSTEIMTSKLVGRHEFLPVPDFEDQIRRLYENLLISLLSDTQLLIVAWAANPDEPSGTRPGTNGTEYPCIRRTTAGYFFYQRKILVTVYAVSFVIVAVGVAYGMKAMRQDGVEELREVTFSSIAVATKGVNLKGHGRDDKIKAWLVEDEHEGRVYEFRNEEDTQRKSSAGATASA
ncbi:uncharacterized protein BKA55DRAFT_544205 [Fusarium redolens]|uniref:Uncharacterized protein n=1 Tax=Fusarium redolens TaxID=48865 RepID=A0A9P9G9I8_FUSRE|nr:uncharacterized protein BKA55DRAFT_544205 [Fusarium redolens]KAH7235021.1 hypothetical protein BKA55DRAFT_544205 [Fusarium redolens]